MRANLRLRTLIEPDRGDLPYRLPEALRERYGGDLRFPPPAGRPYVFANFVSTLDGVVSYGLPGRSGGGTISGNDTGDRFVMALLRASAEAIMVGAGTLRDVPEKVLWLPEQTDPEGGERWRAYRSQVLGLDRPPLLVVVSGSGRLTLDRAIFSTPAARAVIFTSAAGEARLVRQGVRQHTSVTVHALASGQAGLAPGAMLKLLEKEYGIRHLLLEGGPNLLGQFLRLGLLDELFLTIAPQIAGRETAVGTSAGSSRGPLRSPLVDGVAFQPEDAPWWRLVSVKSREEFLYLRYRVRSGGGVAQRAALSPEAPSRSKSDAGAGARRPRKHRDPGKSAGTSKPLLQ